MTAGRLGARLLTAGIAMLSLIPLANWIPNERAAPWFSTSLSQWAVGTAVVGLVAVALAVASRTVPGLWRDGALGRALAAFDPANTRALVTVAAVALAGYLAVAAFVFDGRPLHIDEVVQLLQAKMLARGHLSMPVDPDPAFRSILHLVDHGGRWFGHFPPGWPLLLALGDLVASPWIVAPLVGAVSVFGWGLLLRRLETAPSVRAGGLLLFAFAPFTAFMAGSHMNHPAALMWILLAVVGLVRYLERPGIGRASAAGFAIGMAALTRPADALAFALPAAVWLVATSRRTNSWRSLPGFVLGALPPLLFFVAANWATTGSPLVSGYQLLWGSNVGLGFHAVPWGAPHTPVRGLELVNLYLLRLNHALFETPVPAVLFPLAGLFFSGRLSALDRYLIAATGLLVVLYFGYWHDGVYLGPRFLYPALPLLTLATARLPQNLLAMTRSTVAARAAAFAFGLAMLWAVASGIPSRAAVYAASQPTMRFDPDRASRDAGIGSAVVFVQESWGAQLVARLWALGVAKPAAERFYRQIDGCALEETLGELESRGAKTEEAVARLTPLTADSASLLRSPFSPDTSERVRNGAKYTRRCVSRINEDRAGFTLLAPLWLARRPDIVYVRNLHERNAALLGRYPDRATFLLRRSAGTGELEFLKLNRDSILLGETTARAPTTPPGGS